MGLFLFRNEMKKYEEYFEKEKKILSNLYFLKDKQEIYNYIGIDLE